jgi:hypothetical protein
MTRSPLQLTGRGRRRGSRGLRPGLTIIELMIAMIMGLIVVSAATGFALSTTRQLIKNEGREDYARKARFIGMAFRRDVGEAGVSMSSNPGFGSVNVGGDTIVFLSRLWAPTEVPAYTVVWDTASWTPVADEGPCGTNCIFVRKSPANTALNLVPGDLSLLNVGGARRLLLITEVNNGSGADSAQVRFLNVTTLLRYPANLTGLTLITNTSLYKLQSIIYWRDPSDSTLRRASNMTVAGALNGQVVATAVVDWNTGVIFEDATSGDSLSVGTAGRAFTNINAAWARATVGSDRVDPRDPAPLRRTYEWRAVPRNLIFERNR